MRVTSDGPEQIDRRLPSAPVSASASALRLPAGTITHTVRGEDSLSSKSSHEVAPVAPSSGSAGRPQMLEVVDHAGMAISWEAADDGGGCRRGRWQRCGWG